MIKPLEIHYEVRGYDCGYGGPLKPFALANFFQETAGVHATVLGIGMEDMWARGLTWMLSRIDIRIEAMPRTGQRVIARTWPVGAKKIYAQRCLELLDESGFRYAGALYEYIIVDMKTRRVVRPERTLPIDLTTDYPLPFVDLSPGVEDASFGAFPQATNNSMQDKKEPYAEPKNTLLLNGFSEVFALEARTRHIDQNGHVNNAHFINWLCDAVPCADGETICRIKVDFVREILKGGQISVWIKPIHTISNSVSENALKQAEKIKAPHSSWLSALACDGILAAQAMITATNLVYNKLK